MTRETPSEPALAAPPLILTLKLDQSSFDRVNLLRQQHFPPARNFLPAHITLFHALPGVEEPQIRQQLHKLCSQTAPIALHLAGVRSLGRGVAIEVESPALLQLQQNLAKSWHDWLTPQDRQHYRPHITIQNKVAPEQARQLLQQFAQEWQPLSGSGEGLLLWYYRGGPWERVEEIGFAAAEVG